MATVRKTGGTLRERLFGYPEDGVATARSGPGQGMSWSQGPTISPRARSFLSPFGGGPVVASVDSVERDATFRWVGGHAGRGDIERLRDDDV